MIIGVFLKIFSEIYSKLHTFRKISIQNYIIFSEISFFSCTFRKLFVSLQRFEEEFVTTFGVANGLHRSIVNSEVTMDDLFHE